jgi:hypothetical protein
LEDQSEIYHGIEIAQAEIQRQELCLEAFPQQLLRSLPEALSLRRAWTFVACFCPQRFQEERRGLHCLQFDTFSNWEPRLRPSGLHAEVQYHRVIYQPREKRKAIHSAVDSIAKSAVRNSRANLQGPWAEPMVRMHARIASQSLMNIIASFKRCTFEWEDEWRVVCSPKHSAAGSAPDMDDDRFRPLIKGGAEVAKRHVELRIPQWQRCIVDAFPRSEIPLSRIDMPDDCAGRDAERTCIREALSDSGRSDIEVR